MWQRMPLFESNKRNRSESISQSKTYQSDVKVVILLSLLLTEKSFTSLSRFLRLRVTHKTVQLLQFFGMDWQKFFFAEVHGLSPRMRVTSAGLVSLHSLENISVEHIHLICNFQCETFTENSNGERVESLKRISTTTMPMAIKLVIVE